MKVGVGEKFEFFWEGEGVGEGGYA